MLWPAMQQHQRLALAEFGDAQAQLTDVHEAMGQARDWWIT